MASAKLGQALINRQRLIYNYKKNRAKQVNVEFTIPFHDISFPNFCPVLGVALEYFGAWSKYSPSFDRINPELGYVPGNVQIISHLANAMKANANEKELIKFSRWVDNTYGIYILMDK
tara:strand:- start:1084 stop:1437 length:354 start_codon:yes stop_codon:yes gene_type:complete